MGEPGSGASRGVGLVAVVRDVLEGAGVADALVVAEAVVLCRDHPEWAVWRPAPGGGWTAVRPAGSRPPGPEVAMVWVQADSAGELDARMRRADGALAPPG
jgi:hypothetical protein